MPITSAIDSVRQISGSVYEATDEGEALDWLLGNVTVQRPSEALGLRKEEPW